jgi:hypothetical protein
MPTSLETAIRDRLASYLAGEITLRQFEDWFVPASWNRAGQGNASLDALIGEIELRLAELTSGHRTEMELRELLSPLVTHYVIDAATTHTAADNILIRMGAALLPESAGTLRISEAVSV